LKFVICFTFPLQRSVYGCSIRRFCRTARTSFFDHRSFIREDFMTEARTKARLSKARLSKDRFPEYTAGDTQRIGIGAALVLAVVTALGMHTLVSAPAIRDAAQAELVRVIADEDRDVCGQFGLRQGTSAFVACSRELANVRRKQSDRDQAAAAGIL
jgi:hypothetical protein